VIAEVFTRFLKFFVAPVKWDWFYFFFYGRYPGLTELEKDYIYTQLKLRNYVILSRRSTHLTTYLITLGHRLLTGGRGYWSHACINIEGDRVNSPREIIILESTSKGVTRSGFDEVFDCDSCALLLPRYSSEKEWGDAIETAKKYVGYEYDALNDLESDKAVNCVELLLLAIKTIPNHRDKFRGVFAYLDKYKKLTPDMLEDCGSFTTYYEISKGSKAWRK
jgi:hypothetical protein